MAEVKRNAESMEKHERYLLIAIDEMKGAQIFVAYSRQVFENSSFIWLIA